MKDPAFLHTHPFAPFLYPGVEKVIVGTLPPPRFTTGDLKPDDVNFCYGSRDGLLWKILDRIFELGLEYNNGEAAVQQRKAFLRSRKLGICDIVHSARRDRINASDLGMRSLQLRDLFGYLEQYPSIHTLLFTGGNSKNGPEHLFRKVAREAGTRLYRIGEGHPRIHEFNVPGNQERKVRTVSLIAPTGTANLAIGSMQTYKARRQRDPGYSTLDFRIEQYREYF